MFPLQWGQLLCAVATARSVTRMEIVGDGGEQWQILPWQLMLTAPGDCRMYTRRHVFSGWLSVANLSDVIHPSDTLIVAPLFTKLNLQTLNKTLSGVLWPGLPWLIITFPEMLSSALNTLPWQLDNQVMLLSIGTVATVYDAYRPASHLPLRSRVLTTIRSPTLEPTDLELRPLQEDLFSGRNNLTGLVLRCSVMEWPPYTILADNPDGTVNVTGFYGDIWLYLQQMLGFTGVCKRPKDDSWGGKDQDTGRWTGVLGEVHRGEADISPTPFSITTDRYRGVDFSLGVAHVHSVMVIQKPKGIDGSTNYTQEFSTSVWWTIFAFYVICVAMMNMITKISSVELARDFSYSLVTNFRIFCNMGFASDDPRVVSYRSWLLLVVTSVQVLHVYYSAFLIAIVASSQIALPFEDLNGLYNKRSEYQLGILKDSFLVSEFKQSDDPILRSLWTTVSQDSLLEADEGVDRLRKDAKFAYLLPRLYFIVNHKSCDLLELPKKYFRKLEGMPLTPRGPANTIINRALTKMIESAVLEQRRRVWFRTKSDSPAACGPDGVSPLGLRETYTAFVLLGMIALAALLIFGLECIKYKLVK